MWAGRHAAAPAETFLCYGEFPENGISDLPNLLIPQGVLQGDLSLSSLWTWRRPLKFRSMLPTPGTVISTSAPTLTALDFIPLRARPIWIMRVEAGWTPTKKAVHAR